MAAPAVAGYTWSPITLPATGFSNTREHTAALGSLLLLGGGAGEGIWYSTDGENWTEATSQFSDAGKEVERLRVSGGLAIAYGYDSIGATELVSYSTDGITWTTANRSWSAPVTANGAHFAKDDVEWFATTNGSSWALCSGIPDFSNGSEAAAYFGGVYLLWGYDFESSAFKVFSSPDLSAWTQRLSVAISNPRQHAASPSRLVIPFENGTLYATDDGVSWSASTPANIPDPPDLCGYSSAEELFILAGGGNAGVTPIVSTSADGGAWTSRLQNASYDTASAFSELFNGGHYALCFPLDGAYNTLAGWAYATNVIGAPSGSRGNFSITSTDSASIMLASADGVAVGWLLVEEPTPLGEAESSAAASYTLEGTVVIDASAESTADAQSSFVAELAGYEASFSSTAEATSVLSATRLLFATLTGAASGASSFAVEMIRTATHTGSAVASSDFVASPILVAEFYGLISGNAVVGNEELGAEVWVANAETGGFTRYENFAFNSFAQADGKHLGARSDGIYELDGNDDDGDPIQSMVSFGLQDFGTTALKRVTHAYIGMRGDAELFLRVIVEDGQDYLYRARSSAEYRRTERIDLGRGLRQNMLEFELYNSDGADFYLSSVEFIAIPLSRRI